MTCEALKHQIIEILRREYSAGMINLFEGNVSARLGSRIFITPSQVSKLATTEDMLIETDPEGNIIELPEGLRPTTELKMHLELYRLRPDVNAVVHNHPVFATAFAMNHLPIASDALTELNLTLKDIPVASYGTPGTEELYADFERLLPVTNGLLLANHGLITYGRDLETAYSYAEAAEKSAKTIFIAKLLGDPKAIPAEKLAELKRAL